MSCMHGTVHVNALAEEGWCDVDHAVPSKLGGHLCLPAGTAAPSSQPSV